MYSSLHRLSPSAFPFLRLAALALSLAATFTTITPLHAQRMELTDSSASAVTVESAAIKTEVTGRIAVTTLDLVFRNPNARALEGTFVLPLLDGQSVIRFGLDINGTLREAVPVDKVQGRVVFEEIERRRVDPGLLEKTAGNNYRARVFPLPAHGTRHILIAYQEDVVRGTGNATYRLNLDFPNQLKEFRLAVSAFNGGVPAKVRNTLGLDLPAWRDGQFLEIERENFSARGLLELTLPPADRPRVLTGHRGDREYFYAEAPVALAPRPRPAPKVVGLLWDSSGSGRDRDHKREFALLDAWFASVGDLEVRLVRFRDDAEAATTFKVRGGNWKSLRKDLERTVYDGATSLDGLKDDSSVDEWLLFSDGLINFGATPATAALKFHGPIHTLLASTTADPSWLRSLATRQQGEFVNLLELAPVPAAARLRSRSPRVLHSEFDHSQISEVFPETGTRITENALVVTGTFRGEEAIIRLRVGTSEEDAQTVEITAHAGENSATLAPRGWAVAKIDHLSLNRTVNRADIRRTSRDFGIVSADTSLIVLETIDDYVRYDIEPPAEMRLQWAAYRKPPLLREPAKGDYAHLESLVRSFQERVAWWEQSFPKDAPNYDVRAKDQGPVPPGAMTFRALGAPSEPASFGAPMSAPTTTSTGGAITLSTQGAFDSRGGSAAGRSPSNVQYGSAPASAPAPASKEDDIVMLEAFSVSTEREGFSRAISNQQSSSASTRAVARDVSTGGKRRVASAAAANGESVITLQPWSPDTGYMDRLNRADTEDAYDIYLEERPSHERQPGFFLDVANFFFDRKDAPLGRRILSNLAELQLEDVPLLRVLAHRLAQVDRPDLALPLFERVLELRPDEPQSRRDLALVCADLKQNQRAVDLLWEVADRAWTRFPQIELIALGELNAIAATCGEELDLSRIDPRLHKNLPVQTRVVLTWDANDCDIDLWVADPNGETAIYDHPRTYQGGRMSSDFTDGYGPEEFLLRDPKAGKYRAKINYYGDRRQTNLGPVTAQVRLITGFGTPTQTEKRLTVRLEEKRQTLDVGSFVIAPAAAKKSSKSQPGQ